MISVKLGVLIALVVAALGSQRAIVVRRLHPVFSVQLSIADQPPTEVGEVKLTPFQSTDSRTSGVADCATASPTGAQFPSPTPATGNQFSPGASKLRSGSLVIVGPSFAIVGQSVSSNAILNTYASEFIYLNYTWNFGDGCAAYGPNVTHVFRSPGEYSVSVFVPYTDFGIAAQQINVTSQDQSAPTVTYAAGWNLVGGSGGTAFSRASGPLYTIQAGDTNYETLSNGSGIVGGRGYWAYFPTTTTVPLSGGGSSALPLSISIPAGQFVMVGNPSATQSVTVTGADVVWLFNTASHSYSGGGNTATLQPGQGAWVFSCSGGLLSERKVLQACGSRSPAAAPPAAPTNLRATPLGSTSVRLDWEEQSSGADGFEVYDATTGDFIKTVPGNQTSYTLVSLDRGTLYCAIVYAYNTAGHSAASNQACATTSP